MTWRRPARSRPNGIGVSASTAPTRRAGLSEYPVFGADECRTGSSLQGAPPRSASSKQDAGMAIESI